MDTTGFKGGNLQCGRVARRSVGKRGFRWCKNITISPAGVSTTGTVGGKWWNLGPLLKVNWAVSKNQGYLFFYIFGGPHNKDTGILGSILESPD